MQHEPRVLREPASDRRSFVAGGVVEHHVHAQLGRDGLLDRLEELQELDRAVALEPAFADPLNTAMPGPIVTGELLKWPRGGLG